MKYAVRDAKLVDAFEAVSSEKFVDYSLLGQQVEPVLTGRQVKRILLSLGKELPPSKLGRPVRAVRTTNRCMALIARIVTAYRVDRELTREELASQLEIPAVTLGKIEEGVHDLTVLQLLQMMHIMGRPVTDFIRETEYDRQAL